MGTNETVSPEALIARPSVGRIVHYHDETPFAPPLAAIVTAVITTHTVALTVFDTDRPSYNVARVPASETPKAGHWCWPPRV